MGGRSPSLCWGWVGEKCAEKEGAAYYAPREPPPPGGRGRGVLRVVSLRSRVGGAAAYYVYSELPRLDGRGPGDAGGGGGAAVW